MHGSTTAEEFGVEITSKSIEDNANATLQRNILLYLEQAKKPINPAHRGRLRYNPVLAADRVVVIEVFEAASDNPHEVKRTKIAQFTVDRDQKVAPDPSFHRE